MYQIPILHPVLVHFPIAFLLLAAVTSLVWLGIGSRFWRNVTLILLIAGFIGGLGAYFTGEAAEEFGEGNARVEQFEKQHESSAVFTLVAAGLALFVLSSYTAAYARRLPDGSEDKDMLAARVVVTILALAAAVLVGRTGHLGGLMVWGQPVGGVSTTSPADQYRALSAQQNEGQERGENHD
jgi:uncharacterized membrane protein